MLLCIRMSASCPPSVVSNQLCRLSGGHFGFHIHIFCLERKIQAAPNCARTTSFKAPCSDPRRQHDHLCAIWEYSRPCTLVNYPLKPQMGTPSDMEAHQLVLLFLLSKPKRPGHQSWSAAKFTFAFLQKAEAAAFRPIPTAALWVERRRRDVCAQQRGLFGEETVSQEESGNFLFTYIIDAFCL